MVKQLRWFFRLKSHSDLNQLASNEVELKANLFFHIGNPLKRWKIERVIPIKLILQILKTLFLIVQVCHAMQCTHDGVICHVLKG